MYREETNTYVDRSETVVTFDMPTNQWEHIQHTEAWNTVSKMINEAQEYEDVKNILLGEKNKKTYCVKYSDVPLMKEAIERIDNLHKRLLMSIILPVISLIVSIVALLVQ